MKFFCAPGIMWRWTVSVCVSSAMAYAGTTFTDPTAVNLLERWNPDGTYYYTVTQSNGTPQNAEIFKPGGYGAWRFHHGTSTDKWARFTFPEPIVLGRLMTQWRNNSESPYNYTFYDQNGIIYADTSGPYDSTIRYHTLPAGREPSTYLEVRSSPGNTPNGHWDCMRIGAYAAAGQPLGFDGTFNIFYEEQGKFIRTGYNCPSWTDLSSSFLSPGNANSVTWQFSQSYGFVGAYLTHLTDTYALMGARFDVSADGINWLTARPAGDILGSTYVSFPNFLGGNYLRLSWADSGSGSGREISEIQIFAVPEPATALMLLAVTGVVLLRRRCRAA
jgi:hypothetical protein